MARPSKTPRLKDIDPKAFGEEVARLAIDHVTSLLLQLDPGARWSFEREPAGALLAWLLSGGDPLAYGACRERMCPRREMGL
jgi:hypothetical protein